MANLNLVILGDDIPELSREKLRYLQGPLVPLAPDGNVPTCQRNFTPLAIMMDVEYN